MPDAAPVVMWFRRDLRLADNPALVAAAHAGAVVPLFVLDDALWGPAGTGRRWWLAGCLAELDDAIGGHLVCRHGAPAQVVAAVAAEVSASAVYVAADFGPYGRTRDDAVAAALAGAGAELVRVGSPYAVDPGAVAKADGTPYRVFTPYSKAWRDHGWDSPVPAPRRVRWVEGLPRRPRPAAAPPAGVDLPPPGERAALRRWHTFRQDGLAGYGTRRDRPDLEGTSRLSPYLKFGCIHPRTLLDDLEGSGGAERWRAELCWREFYADVLWHQPGSARRCLQPAMAAMAVDDDEERFSAWAEGRTGYPIVDAGMRQLLAQGWMHNRVRMIVASFLVKDLHLDWTRGARHFMNHLVDGDLASNSHGWQWVAGTGTDAAPYFRIFNPVTQGRRFDPEGDYVRRWVPELAPVAGPIVHEPWTMREVPLGVGAYPDPIVDHATERDEALSRYGRIRGR